MLATPSARLPVDGRLFKRRAIIDYTTIAVSVGVVAGALSALSCLYGAVRDRFVVSWNVHTLWMPMVSEALFALTLYALISPMALLLSRRSFDFVFAGFLVYFSTFALLSGLGGLGTLEIGILSLGLGIQAARTFQEHAIGVRRVCRLVAPTGIVVAVGLAVFVIVLEDWDEANLLASVGSEAAADSPNVILIVWDTVRADYVGTFDEDGAATPNLDELAANGVVFERAVAAASWTLPSHASMLTGKFPTEISADWYTPVGESEVMLAETLLSHGYITGAFVANTIYCGRGTGMSQGFVHFEDFALSAWQIADCNYFFRWFRENWLQSSQFKPGAAVTEQFVGWMQNIPADVPFFGFLNYASSPESVGKFGLG